MLAQSPNIRELDSTQRRSMKHCYAPHHAIARKNAGPCLSATRLQRLPRKFTHLAVDLPRQLPEYLILVESYGVWGCNQAKSGSLPEWVFRKSRSGQPATSRNPRFVGSALTGSCRNGVTRSSTRRVDQGSNRGRLSHNSTPG